MTELETLPPSDPPPEATIVAPKPPRRDLVPWFYAIGFVVLVGAIFYLWQYPSVPNEAPASVAARQAADQRLDDIDARLNRLPDIEARLARIEQRPVPDLGKITARMDALEGRVADQTQLGGRMDAISGRIESLSGRQQTDFDAAKQQIGTLGNRLAALEANAGGLDATSKRLSRITRLQEASVALASGRPLGDLPNAPEVLAHYAQVAPPTEAQLRLDFAAAEKVALAAKQPNETEVPFIDRAWDRAQSLITIRRGDDLLVGTPSATTLNQAKTALDAGDLAGAVAAVESLKGPPAQAMASWLGDAKALLDVRSALAAMADKA
jgi:inner membrane protein